MGGVLVCRWQTIGGMTILGGGRHCCCRWCVARPGLGGLPYSIGFQSGCGAGGQKGGREVKKVGRIGIYRAPARRGVVTGP